jgi:hypothetical protein
MKVNTKYLIIIGLRIIYIPRDNNIGDDLTVFLREKGGSYSKPGYQPTQ